MKIDQLKKQ